MKLLRPNVKVQADIIFSISFPYQFTMDSLKIRKVVHRFYIVEKVQKGQEGIIYIPDGPTVNQLTGFGRFQHLVHHCANSAESILNELRDFLMSVTELAINKETLMEMSFIDLRRLLSDLLKKSGLFNSVDGFKTKAEICEFTSLFYDFIIDRNIYTHGVLMIRLPDNSYVIKYIHDHKYMHADITHEILQSYCDAAWLIAEKLKVLTNSYKAINLAKV